MEQKIDITDASYPEALKHIHKPPSRIFIVGEILEEDKNAIAIVGTRRPSFYGIEAAEKLSYALATLGITIVSGMAKGVDAAAHRGAIKAGGRTIAVMGSGHDNIYPPEHKKLYEEIRKHGAVVTEFPIGTEPERHNFPLRNRIISGMSKGVVVIEAPAKSGALITAGFALEQGREVFAVPGNINSLKSAGSNRLIKDGAKLVENVEDILEELRYVLDIEVERSDAGGQIPEAGKKEELSLEESRIYGFLSKTPTSIHDITRKLNAPPQDISKIILALELKKLVKTLPGESIIKV